MNRKRGHVGEDVVEDGSERCGLIFLADHTNGRAIGTVYRLSVCRRLSVTLCIVAKRCIQEQKLLWRAYRKS